MLGLARRIGLERDPLKVAALTRQLMNENFVQYQDENAMLQPFMIRCQAKLIPLMAEFSSGLEPEEFTDVRKQGLEQARNGMWQIYASVVLAAANPDIHIENRAALLQALADTADTYAAAQRPQQRFEIRMLAKNALEHAPKSLHDNISRIIDAMSLQDCSGLCAL